MTGTTLLMHVRKKFNQHHHLVFHDDQSTVDGVELVKHLLSECLKLGFLLALKEESRVLFCAIAVLLFVLSYDEKKEKRLVFKKTILYDFWLLILLYHFCDLIRLKLLDLIIVRGKKGLKSQHALHTIVQSTVFFQFRRTHVSVYTNV